MQNLYKLLVISLIFTLAACQAKDTNEEKTNENKPALEEEEKVNGEVEEVEQQEDEKETLAIADIEKNILHQWTLTSESTLYLVKNQGEIIVFDDTTALGEKGERQFEGDASFYIVHAGEDVGYLQEELDEIIVNLDRAFSAPYTFREEPIITWAQAEASNTFTTRLWRYTDGELLPVSFDGSLEKIWSSQTIKFIKDSYVQNYYYDNQDSEGRGIGWYFDTWRWDEASESFTLHDETIFTDAEPYGWETGEYAVEIWQTYEDEYILFPELTFTDDLTSHIQEGKLAEDGFKVGDSIDDILAQMPSYSNHDYYNGGPYYNFPGMFSYFYDEGSREVTYVLMSGDSITNDLDSLKSILGTPIDEWDDELDMTTNTEFLLGDYRLRVEQDADGSIISLWLHLNNY